MRWLIVTYLIWIYTNYNVTFHWWESLLQAISPGFALFAKESVLLCRPERVDIPWSNFVPCGGYIMSTRTSWLCRSYFYFLWDHWGHSGYFENWILLNSFAAKFQTTFVVCFFFFFFFKQTIAWKEVYMKSWKTEHQTAQIQMRRLVMRICAVCKSLLLLPMALIELSWC